MGDWPGQVVAGAACHAPPKGRRATEPPPRSFWRSWSDRAHVRDEKEAARGNRDVARGRKARVPNRGSRAESLKNAVSVRRISQDIFRLAVADIIGRLQIVIGTDVGDGDIPEVIGPSWDGLARD